MGCSPSSFSVNDIFPARILEWDTFPSPGDLPNPEIEPGSPALQAGSLPSELQGKLMYTDTNVGWLVQRCPVEARPRLGAVCTLKAVSCKVRVTH